MVTVPVTFAHLPTGLNPLSLFDENFTALAQAIEANGLPSGGVAGAVLLKASATDFDTEWRLLELCAPVPNGVDDTAAFQAAVDAAAGRALYVPAGTYIISTVNITSSITFICEKGAIFKRKAGLDIRQSYWNAGTAMFEVLADGLHVEFHGSPKFDGNKQNQPVYSINPGMAGATTEPAGWSFKYAPINAATATDCHFVFENAEFVNGTSGYILVRGDDITKRFHVVVELTNVSMSDTVFGYGKGDPATPTPLGWTSVYVEVMDYVEIRSHTLFMEWTATPTPVGEYAPVGLFGTYFGVAATSGECILNLSGTTTINGLGRKNQNYDGTNYTTNNGIGAIDVYGNGESLFIENLQATNCESIPARAKASIMRFTVLNAYCKNCRGGLQISTSSTGDPEADVYIGNLVAEDCMLPVLEIVGNSSILLVPSVMVNNAVLRNSLNLEGRSAATAAPAYFRYVESLNVGSIKVETTDDKGVITIEVGSLYAASLEVDASASVGVLLNGTVNQNVVGRLKLSNIGATAGISISGVTKTTTILSGYIDTAVDYGVFANVSAGSGEVNVYNVTVDNLSGLDRGFYFANCDASLTQCKVGAGVTTPLVNATSAKVSMAGNSWNGAETWASAAPTTGTWAVGDHVWNTAPSPTVSLGWVCTTAGSPGTWTAFYGAGALYAVVTNDADFTVTPGANQAVRKHTGTLTADRAVTLSTSAAQAGRTKVRITRTGAGAFNLNVGIGPLKALATNTWADFEYDGAAFYLAAYGAL